MVDDAVYVVVEGLWGKRRKVASARELDNGLLLAMLVWLNLETKKKRESLAKFVMFVRMSQQQVLEISGVAEGGLKVEVLYSENCSSNPFLPILHAH